jgi:hypothetical protein
LGGTESTGVPFSCFALPASFRVLPRASGTILKFCASGLIFDGTEGVWARSHVLRSRTLFGRYRWRQVPFLFFTLPNSFLTELRASGPVCMFCSTEPILGGTEGVGS